MSTFTLAMAIPVNSLIAARMGEAKQDVNPVEINTFCFTQESLKNGSWQKDQLTYFQQPKVSRKK